MAKRTNKSSVQNKKLTKQTPKTSNDVEDSMKMTLHTAPSLAPRSRRPGRPPSCHVKRYAGKARSTARRSLDPCDNSNDSGLGFDHHMDTQTINMTDRLNWTDEKAQVKRPKLDIKLENDEINDNYSFPEHNRTYTDNTTTLIRTAPVSVSIPPSLNGANNQATTSGRVVPRCLPISNRSVPNSTTTLTSQLQQTSRYRDVSLSIMCQPEQQHRARYQTEGSRGAVKDRSGNGFPVVKLEGYHKPATLQVFIGTDLGKVQPHMFYQSCRVSGKNSTPCTEKRLDGTIVIELQLDPSKDMVATCDCVGILKERNVDVEHRFPDQLGSRSKKKSTRCRMVFRTTITHDDGVQETLQVCSQPIVCTQPPGIPEISKKSLTSCPASGGLELFVIGKNFLKDTSVFFQQSDEDHTVRWEQSVIPDKEFLQQTHLVCVVPPYLRPDITEPVSVRLYVVSSGKTSETHQFVYTPVNGAMPSVLRAVEQQTQLQTPQQQQPASFKMLWMTKQEQDVGMMPPPGTNMVPLSQRRTSTNMNTNEVHSPPMRTSLKQEMMDENSQNSVLDQTEMTHRRYRHISESSLDVHQGDSNISMINDNSIDMLRHSHMMHNMNDNSNMSLNDNSMHSICENSLDHPNTSNMSMTDDSCSSMQTNTSVFNQIGLLNNLNNLTPSAHTNILEELKVVDLRCVKIPMATVADLVNTNAPSMATLQSFGVTESSSLPAQSAQSIENYLTNIENKVIINGNKYPPQQQQQHQSALKSEAAAIGEQLPPTIVAIESGLLPNPITTEKLDAIVNCAAETHIQTHLRKMQQKDLLITTPNINPSSDEVTLMCANGDLLQRVVEPLIQTSISILSPQVVNEPEKAIILNAAVDLYETQKKLLVSIPETKEAINTMNNLLTAPNNGDLGANNGFMQYTAVSTVGNNCEIASKSITTLANKSSFVQSADVKKCEDHMIPPSFPTMSENDLINIINPSCFDQV